MTHNQILTFYILETGRGIFRVINSELEMQRAVCLAHLAHSQKLLVVRICVEIKDTKNNQELYWFSLGHKLFRLERHVYCAVPGVSPVTGFTVTHHGDGAEVMAVGTERKDVIADTLRVLYKTNRYDEWSNMPLLPKRLPVARFSLDGETWYDTYESLCHHEFHKSRVSEVLRKSGPHPIKNPGETTLIDA